jgi:hypothetical protein
MRPKPHAPPDFLLFRINNLQCLQHDFIFGVITMSSLRLCAFVGLFWPFSQIPKRTPKNVATCATIDLLNVETPACLSFFATRKTKAPKSE